jgi:hypothetical protein
MDISFFLLGFRRLGQKGKKGEGGDGDDPGEEYDSHEAPHILVGVKDGLVRISTNA